MVGGWVVWVGGWVGCVVGGWLVCVLVVVSE